MTQRSLRDRIPSSVPFLALLAWSVFVGPIAPVRGGLPGVGIAIDAVSDEFEAPWTFDAEKNLSSNGLWYGQFRGAPEIVNLIAPPGGDTVDTTAALRLRSVDSGNDAFPGMEDLVSVFYDTTLLRRFVQFSEEPSFVTWVHFPPVAEWPLTAEGQNCFGFRLAGRDATLVSDTNAQGEYYPSLWAHRGKDGFGYLVARVGDGFTPDVIIAQVAAGGWYTLGMSCDAQARIEYYATTGRGPLGPDALLYTDTVSARTLDHVVYHFFSLRFPANGALSPDFLADRCRVFTRLLPSLPTLRPLAFDGATFRMAIGGATSGFAYRVERRDSLTAGAWQEVERFVSDGGTRTLTDSVAGPTMFYRVARGPEMLPPNALAQRSVSAAPQSGAKFKTQSRAVAQPRSIRRMAQPRPLRPASNLPARSAAAAFPQWE